MGFIAFQVLVILGVVSLLVIIERKDAEVRRMQAVVVRKERNRRR